MNSARYYHKCVYCLGYQVKYRLSWWDFNQSWNRF